MRTLIAEDDPPSQLLLKTLMERHGFVHAVPTGKAAVEAVKVALDYATPYDVICLDIMMPEMDGLDALKLIRALELERNIPQERRAKILMVTALDDLQNISDSIDNAADGYLVKPVSNVKLTGILHGFGLHKLTSEPPTEV